MLIESRASTHYRGELWTRPRRFESARAVRHKNTTAIRTRLSIFQKRKKTKKGRVERFFNVHPVASRGLSAPSKIDRLGFDCPRSRVLRLGIRSGRIRKRVVLWFPVCRRIRLATLVFHVVSRYDRPAWCAIQLFLGLVSVDSSRILVNSSITLQSKV